MIGLIQKSFWLIDPYWSIIPTIFGFMWRMHPSAAQNTRGDIAIILSIVWGIRLTYSYFRREDWKFGMREDWRYTKMAIDYGWPYWYAISFFAVGVAQHPMIVGISLPLYSVQFGEDLPWDYQDTIITILCLTGIAYACIADN